MKRTIIALSLIVLMIGSASAASMTFTSSNNVSAMVRTTGASSVIVSMSSTNVNGVGETCLNLAVDGLDAMFCEGLSSGSVAYQCNLTSDGSVVQGSCSCEPGAPEPAPTACEGLEEGCAAAGGVFEPTENGGVCEFE